MRSPQIRTTECNVREAKLRLRSARAYLEVAELILGEDREEFAGVAAGNAVLAGIAGADAICGRGLKKRFRGEDHRQGAELLGEASQDGAKNKVTLLRLLDLKDQAHYGFDTSKATALKSVKLARSLVSRAEIAFQR